MASMQRYFNQPAAYRIKVQGGLSQDWSDWFDGLSITVEHPSVGQGITTLTGTIIDQVALHGLLARIRDLGLPLLLVLFLGHPGQRDAQGLDSIPGTR